MDCLHNAGNFIIDNIKNKMIKKEMTTILGSGLSGIGAMKLAIKKNIPIDLLKKSFWQELKK